MLISVLAGAILNIGMNFILIPKYSYIGAAISLLATEITVAVIRIYYGKQYVNINLFGKNFIKSLVATIVMGITVLILQKNFHTTVILNTGLSVMAGVVVYTVMLIMTKEELFIEETAKLRKKLKL